MQFIGSRAFSHCKNCLLPLAEQNGDGSSRCDEERIICRSCATALCGSCSFPTTKGPKMRRKQVVLGRYDAFTTKIMPQMHVKVDPQSANNSPAYHGAGNRPQLCCLRKKSPWICFCEIFAPFRDFFDEIRTFGDNPVIADCPKSNRGRLWHFFRNEYHINCS